MTNPTAPIYRDGHRVHPNDIPDGTQLTWKDCQQCRGGCFDCDWHGGWWIWPEEPEEMP